LEMYDGVWWCGLKGLLIVCVLCLLAQGKASNEVSLKLCHINLAGARLPTFSSFPDLYATKSTLVLSDLW
jgi:hypothetical protein